MQRRANLRRGTGVLAAAVALLALTTQAGDIKMHHWPSQFVPQQIPGVEIPVLMDFDMFVVSVVGGPIRLHQVSPYTYEGCSNLFVRCNVNVHLSVSIVPTGAVGGDYSCSLSNPDIDAPSGIAILCAKLENAERGGQHGPGTSVRVAAIKVMVVPR